MEEESLGLCHGEWMHRKKGSGKMYEGTMATYAKTSPLVTPQVAEGLVTCCHSLASRSTLHTPPAADHERQGV